MCVFIFTKKKEKKNPPTEAQLQSLSCYSSFLTCKLQVEVVLNGLSLPFSSSYVSIFLKSLNSYRIGFALI